MTINFDLIKHSKAWDEDAFLERKKLEKKILTHTHHTHTHIYIYIYQFTRWVLLVHTTLYYLQHCRGIHDFIVPSSDEEIVMHQDKPVEGQMNSLLGVNGVNITDEDTEPSSVVLDGWV